MGGGVRTGRFGKVFGRRRCPRQPDAHAQPDANSAVAAAPLDSSEGSSDEFCRCQVCLGKYTLLGDEENPRLAMFERRLPCFGCGIGWCCFLSGFLCPLIWYIATLLYCCKYYNRDPRERPGLAASAVLAVIFTAATIVTLSVLLIMCAQKRFLNCCVS